MQAVIIVGGKGTRLRPLTDQHPKPIVSIANKPFLAYQLELLRRHGITDVIFCTQYLADNIKNTLGNGRDYGVKITYVQEKEPLGTAGAVKNASAFFTGEDLLVLNGDILTDINLSQLINYHLQKKAVITITVIPVCNPSAYGLVVFDEKGCIKRFIEKPSVSQIVTNTVNAGVYCLKASLFEDVPSDKFYSFERDVFPKFLETKSVYAFYTDSYWLDIGTLENYYRANFDILQGKLKTSLKGEEIASGVYVESGTVLPESLRVSGQALIGRGVKLGNNVEFRGFNVIGDHCRLADRVVLDSSIIWAGCHIEEDINLTSCVIGENCHLRGSALVQAGSVLGDNTVIDNLLARVPSLREQKRSSIKFGTDGWRGIIGDDFNYENVRFVSQGLANFIKKEAEGEKSIFVGYDTRFSSDDFAKEAAKVFVYNGIKTYLSLCPVTSPAAAWTARQMNSGGAVVVTASHNPPKFNGIKYKNIYGGAALPSQTLRIENELTDLELNFSDFNDYDEKSLTDKIIYYDATDGYLNYLEKLVDLSLIEKLQGVVVVDYMYGAAGGYFKKIFKDRNFVREIRREPNPCFGKVNPEPIKINLSSLVKAVKKEGAFLGLALDGDGDRIGALDSQGNFVNSHQIFALILDYLVKVKGQSGGVVKSISTSRLISLLADKYKLKVYETPVGFKHICDIMLKEDILIGGEESGGIGIRGHIPERDGVLAGLLLMEIVAYYQKPIEEILRDLYQEFGEFYYTRKDLHLKKEDVNKLSGRLPRFMPEDIGEISRIDAYDGRKIHFADGSWLFLRLSGTEPLLRVYAESNSLEKTEDLIKRGEEFVFGK